MCKKSRRTVQTKIESTDDCGEETTKTEEIVRQRDVRD